MHYEYTLRYLGVELSSHCSLACSVCARHTMTRKPGHMPRHMAERVAYAIRKHFNTLPWEHRDHYVVLNCWGEPTLNPELLAIIPMFHGLRTVLSTNCVRYVKGLADSGLSELLLSTDSCDEARAENAKRYLQAAGSDTDIKVQLLITPENQYQTEQFVAEFKPLLPDNACIFIKYPILDPGCEYKPLRKDLYDLAGDKIIVAGDVGFTPRGRSCDKGASTLVVQSDGDVMMHCCSVNKEMVIGRYDDEYKRLINGAKAQALRSSVCAACTGAGEGGEK